MQKLILITGKEVFLFLIKDLNVENIKNIRKIIIVEEGALGGQRKWVDVQLLIGIMMGQYCRSSSFGNWLSTLRNLVIFIMMQSEETCPELSFKDIRDEQIWPKPTQHLGKYILREYKARGSQDFGSSKCREYAETPGCSTGKERG